MSKRSLQVVSSPEDTSEFEGDRVESVISLDEAWVVHEGYVDLFITSGPAADSRGPLVHLKRLGQHEALVGLCHSIAESAIDIIARGAPGTKIGRVSINRLSADDKERRTTEWLIRLAQYTAQDGSSTGLDVGSLLVEAQIRLDKEILDSQLSWDDYVGGVNASMSHSLEALVSTIQNGTDHRPSQEYSNNPLVSACLLAGSAMGIDLVVPASIEKGSDLSLNEVVEGIARASHVRFRLVRLEEFWWEESASPMVAATRTGDPVALLPGPNGQYICRNCTTGQERRMDAGVQESLLEYVFFLYPALPHRSLTTRDVLHFAFTGIRNEVVLILAMGTMTGLLGLLPPLLTGHLIDAVIPGALINELALLACALCVVALCSALFYMTRGFTLMRMEVLVSSRMQAAIWDRLLKLPIPFFAKYSAGDLGRRANAIELIRSRVSGVFLNSALSSIFSLSSLAVLFYLDLRLALVGLAMGLFGVAVSLVGGLVQVRYERKILAVSGELGGKVLEFVSGISKLRLAGCERHVFNRWSLLFSKERRLRFRAGIISNYVSVFGAIFPILSSGCVYLVMMEPGGASLSAGGCIAFMAALASFLQGLVALANACLGVADIIPLYERALPILEAVPEVDERRANPGTLDGHLEVSNLSFRYSADSPDVLRDVSIQAEPGEFIAIVGESGCGKSTLLNLLLGFESPQSGRIFYDSHDLQHIDVRAVRRQVGVVLQNDQVIPGDILTNIRGSSFLDIETCWEAARLANIADDIAAMPMGMHTMLPQGGSALSGGQRQRLLIARAIARIPRIIFLDEGTSALDNESQSIVSESLEQMGVTRVVVAHRLTTIKNADRIYVLEGGRVAEVGSFNELLGRGGVFANLAKRQLL